MSKLKDIIIEVQELLDEGTSPSNIAELLCINKQMVYDIQKQYKPEPKSKDQEAIDLFHRLGMMI